MQNKSHCKLSNFLNTKGKERELILISHHQERTYMAVLTASHMANAFGVLGSIVSFLVYLAPLPTFYRIYKKKSTEGFQSIPYAVALFSAMIYLYYAFIKADEFVLLIINSIGGVIESGYLIMFLIYAIQSAKVYTIKLLVLFNVGAYGLIILSTSLLSKGHHRVTIVGWICSIFSVCVFAAPLTIMRLVIRTKSVEYMPFSLSIFLTLSAVMWFFYGFLIKDYYVATPNVLGFTFGVAQMILYLIYKDGKKPVLPEVTNIEKLTSKEMDDKKTFTEGTTKAPADIEMGNEEQGTAHKDSSTMEPSVVNNVE